MLLAWDTQAWILSVIESDSINQDANWRKLLHGSVNNGRLVSGQTWKLCYNISRIICLLWNRKERNKVNFPWWIITTHLVLKQSWILDNHRTYFLLSWINPQQKYYVLSELKVSQRKISALPLASAILPALPVLKGFIMKLNIHVSLMELLLLLSLYHLSWAEKNNVMNTNFL